MGTKGTKEWADWNLNLFKGCSNNCRYCYAKNMAKQFGRIKSFEEWANPVLNKKIFFQGFRKRKGRGMYPTAHGITPQTFTHYGIVLLRLLQAGNEVLITTKPNFNLIKILCSRLIMWTDKVQFRFTITSMDDELLKYWEPNAPNYENRKSSLMYARLKGFKTSVSIEPFLDDPIPLIKDIEPHITETIWIGIMNPKYNKYYPKILPIYNHENVEKLVERLKREFSYIDNGKRVQKAIFKKIRLKDSIRNMGISLG